MPLMILTGWAMVFLAWGGFGALPWSINAMQGLGILMALIFIYGFFRPLAAPAPRRPPRPGTLHPRPQPWPP